MTARNRRSAAAVLGYGVVSYAAFLAVALYAVGFLADAVVPTTVDGPRTWAATGSTAMAVVVDLALLGLFGVQHSVMARAGFKRWWGRYVPVPIERSTYVLATSVVLFGVFTLWQPLPTVVWDVPDGPGRTVVWALYGLGWVTVVGSTFLIDHFDLFGLRQVYLAVRDRRYRAPGFVTPLLYRVVRHPLMLGFFIVFWATPTMTVGHLLFAVVISGYIVVGTSLEERDLVAETPEYADYAARTPRFFPRVRSRSRLA